MRLQPETAARKSLKEHLNIVTKPQGRAKIISMQIIRQDMNSIEIKLDLSKSTKTLNRLSEMTQDRKNWRSI